MNYPFGPFWLGWSAGVLTAMAIFGLNYWLRYRRKP